AACCPACVLCRPRAARSTLFPYTTLFRSIFLAWIYVCRSIAVTAFLLFPQTPTSVVVFSIVIGLLWLSTVPPTNALVAIMFGTRSEEHTSELQSRENLVCRLLLEKKQ